MTISGVNDNYSLMSSVRGFLGQGGFASINNNGDIAFNRYVDGDQRVFVYHDGVEIPINVEKFNATMLFPDINDNGVVAFTAFSDTTQGVFIATPVVPEPISSILFVTGGSLLAGRRLLRRKA